MYPSYNPVTTQKEQKKKAKGFSQYPNPSYYEGDLNTMRHSKMTRTLPTASLQTNVLVSHMQKLEEWRQRTLTVFNQYWKIPN